MVADTSKTDFPAKIVSFRLTQKANEEKTDGKTREVGEEFNLETCVTLTSPNDGSIPSNSHPFADRLATHNTSIFCLSLFLHPHLYPQKQICWTYLCGNTFLPKPINNHSHITMQLRRMLFLRFYQ